VALGGDLAVVAARKDATPAGLVTGAVYVFDGLPP
jgi:hypothetical protein